MSQDRQDLYRDFFAALHEFSQSRFGVVADISDLRINIVDGACGGIVSGGSPQRIDHLTFGDECMDDQGLFESWDSRSIAEAYFQLLVDWRSAFSATPDWTTEWMLYGTMLYFSSLWVDHHHAIPYEGFRNGTLSILSSVRHEVPPLSQDPDPDTAGSSSLAFLAIDYLAEQTGATKPIDYFTAARRSTSTGFAEDFQSVFGISPDEFYRYFAAHRAAGFPQPGAPFGPTPTPTHTYTPTATPVLAPIVADGRIVFSSDRREGLDEIYAMNADGSNLTRIINHLDTYALVHPVWSPDGQRIAFTGAHLSGDFSEIFATNADGSNLTLLASHPLSGVHGHNDEPAWSPDGQRIAFESSRDGNQEIYVANVADGSNLTRLTNHPASDKRPDWTSGGADGRIVFSSDRDGNQEIYVMDAAGGSNLTRLTNNPGDDDEPVWSPDGQQIAFTSDRDGINAIYVMNADGSNQTRLTGQIERNDEPAWSPDGQYIVFESRRDGNPEIYVMNADGSNQTRLTNDPGADRRPDWTSAVDGQEPDPVSPTPTHTPTHTPTATPVTGGEIDNRVSELERQTGMLQQLIQNLQALIQALTNRVDALDGGTTPVATSTATPTATPSPTPTSVPGADPTPVTNNACIQQIELDALIAGTTIAGTWTTDCLTANPDPTYPTLTFYAKFYTFTLDGREELEFRITSDETPYIFLMAGAGTDGEVITRFAIESGEQAQLILDPGSYTLEVTTDQLNVTGDFDLWMGLRARAR